MTIDNKIKDEKLQYNVTREAAKISAYHQAELIDMNILRQRNITFWSKSNDTTS